MLIRTEEQHQGNALIMARVDSRSRREPKVVSRRAVCGVDPRKPAEPDVSHGDALEDPANAEERRQCMIAEAAYFVAMRRGLARGYELDNWLTAERDIDAALAQEPGIARGRKG